MQCWYWVCDTRKSIDWRVLRWVEHRNSVCTATAVDLLLADGRINVGRTQIINDRNYLNHSDCDADAWEWRTTTNADNAEHVLGNLILKLTCQNNTISITRIIRKDMLKYWLRFMRWNEKNMTLVTSNVINKRCKFSLNPLDYRSNKH